MTTLDVFTGAVKLPDGRQLKDVSSNELSTILMNMNIPGIDSSQGLQAQADIYRAWCEDIHHKAGQQALAEWLNGKAATP